MEREELKEMYGHNYEKLSSERQEVAMSHVYRMYNAPLNEKEERILAAYDKSIKEARFLKIQRDKEKREKLATEERL